jgi:osomolarity two-component system, sensor histidine kinase SLN1
MLSSFISTFFAFLALALQNLEASGMVDNENRFEFTALGGSLRMMSKVLSDILDL